MADIINIEGTIFIAEGALDSYNLHHLLPVLADKFSDAVNDISSEINLPSGEMSLVLTAIPEPENIISLHQDTKTLSKEVSLRSNFRIAKS